VNNPNLHRVVVLWQRILRAQAIIQACITEATTIIPNADSLASGHHSIANIFGASVDPKALYDRPIVDATAMSVTWRGERCPLGYTRSFDLMERLARNPNRWIPYDRLLREVWKNDSFNEETIKVAVTRLKKLLVNHGMSGLAEKILTSGDRCGYHPDGLFD
jgi:hypothetical protein